MEEDKKKKKVYKKLRNKYRLVVLNDDTFEERISLRLTPLNVFTYVGLVVIILIVSLISLIAFTPLREYIPGYSDTETRRNAAYAVFKSDSLSEELARRDWYINNIRNILEGNPPQDTLDSEVDSNRNYSAIRDNRSRDDSLLRESVEAEERFTINDNLQNRNTRAFFFFTPLKGMVSSSYNPDIEHYGVDVVANENEAIKCVLDGTVVIANWTTDDGYVIQVQHRGNLLSVYKHCSVLLKRTGEAVKAGEPIAIVGNSGEHTTGPHLHFELWENGTPVNPEEYIDF
ncbi:MAG: M23 family metallopeptidase [Leptolyngbya sp. SIO3F4]|nr:M23 family metallopeptidase [Leptolyngbya sp. SIO3F4]